MMEEIKHIYALSLQTENISKACGQAGSALPQKALTKVVVALTTC